MKRILEKLRLFETAAVLSKPPGSYSFKDYLNADEKVDSIRVLGSKNAPSQKKLRNKLVGMEEDILSKLHTKYHDFLKADAQYSDGLQAKNKVKHCVHLPDKICSDCKNRLDEK